MDFEFDKEIDAILRKARGDEVAAVFEVHPDADEISAYAENALPQRARQRYTAHLAECTRCRKILSNLILLNSEAAAVSASSVVPAAVTEAKTPWYRKFFTLPQLVYGMGALVVLFSAFLGFLVLQSLTGSYSKDVSYSANTSAPQAYPTGFPSSGAANSNTASTTTNTSSTTTSTNTSSAPVYQANTAANTTDAKTNSEAQSPSVATGNANSVREVPQDEIADRDDQELAKTENKPQSGVTATNTAKEEKQKQTDNAKRSQEEDKILRAPVPLATPGSSPRPKSAKKDSQAGETRQVSGKTFRNVGGIWFDSAYTSQRQISVTRGTSQYQKLDSGLRSIGDSLSGTVVVVWGSKAYRIQ